MLKYIATDGLEHVLGGVSESQTIALEAVSAVSGVFPLSYKGVKKTQPAIPADASADAIAGALRGLGLNDVSISGTQHGKFGYAWLITFGQTMTGIEKLVAYDEYVVGDNSVVNNYDTVVLTSSAEDAHWTNQLPMSSKFRIYVGRERTAPLSFDATNEKGLPGAVPSLRFRQG